MHGNATAAIALATLRHRPVKLLVNILRDQTALADMKRPFPLLSAAFDAFEMPINKIMLRQAPREVRLPAAPFRSGSVFRPSCSSLVFLPPNRNHRPQNRSRCPAASRLMPAADAHANQPASKPSQTQRYVWPSPRTPDMRTCVPEPQTGYCGWWLRFLFHLVFAGCDPHQPAR